MKYSFVLLCLNIPLLFNSIWSFSPILAQYHLSDQNSRLRQYSGTWNSSIHPNTDSVSVKPSIRMFNSVSGDSKSLFVEVEQLKDSLYQNLLVEMISYDKNSDTIIALVQRSDGSCFIGKGKYTSETDWVMFDKDLLGNDIMNVSFKFNSYTDVLVQGFNNEQKRLWQTRYIKQNPKDKKIGVQLVSVHDEMLHDAENTLLQLSRMGYSDVETFVYKEGMFYGMSPNHFKEKVESVGMKFVGSMTFKDLPTDGGWKSTMDWWLKCIQDHKEAGVKYISTSNNQLKQVSSQAELQLFCDYYNAIGDMCKKNGIQFVFHNHSDEFRYVEGVCIYNYFLEHTNPELVAFQADLYWMHIGGANPVNYFHQYPGRFFSWHIKDYKELGESGKIPFREYVEYAEKSGVQYLIAEVEDYSYPPLYSTSLAWEYIYHTLLND